MYAADRKICMQHTDHKNSIFKKTNVNIWLNEKKIAPSVGFEPTRVNPIDF